jgi:hypothetical protein
MHFEGSVPEFICLPADCYIAEDSSDDESADCMDCSDHEPPFCLGNKNTSTKDNVYSFTIAKNKMQ